MADTATSEDTYDRIHKRTWGKRTAGFLGAATMFGAFGAIGGAVVSFMPAVMDSLGVPGVISAGLPEVGAILGNAALLGGAAAWLGVTIGADVGANAGAATATIEEQERINKARGLAKVPEREEPAKKPKMFNWKVALTMGALFAAFGAIVALNTLTAPGVVAALGFKAGSTAASVACATIVGLFGATMGFNFPYISNKLSNGYSKWLKGEIFEKAPEQQPAQSESLAAEAPQQTAPAIAKEKNCDHHSHQGGKAVAAAQVQIPVEGCNKHSSRVVRVNVLSMAQRGSDEHAADCPTVIQR